MASSTFMKNALKALLPADVDADLVCYVSDMVEAMEPEERAGWSAFRDSIFPYIEQMVDEEGAELICKQLYDVSLATCEADAVDTSANSSDAPPLLLGAPIRINDRLSVPSATSISPPLPHVPNVPSAAATNTTTTTIPSTPLLPHYHRDRPDKRLAAIRQRAQLKPSQLASLSGTVRWECLSVPHPSGSGELLSDLQLSLTEHRRYGLLGTNGVGKTTLLRHIASYDLPEVRLLNIVMVDQQVSGDADSALQWVLAADAERYQLLQEEMMFNAMLADMPEKSDALPFPYEGMSVEAALGLVYDRLDIVQSSSALARATALLSALGFTEASMHVPTSSLSGGWCVRAALAAAVFAKADILLLDEPTNHLDAEAMVWLEWFLTQRFDGIAVIVSHDTCFLDTVCTDILELRKGGGASNSGLGTASMELFPGDYRNYLCNASVRERTLARQKAAADTQREKLKDQIHRENKKLEPTSNSRKKQQLKALDASAAAHLENNSGGAVTPASISLPPPRNVFDAREGLIQVMCVSFGWQNISTSGSDLFQNADFCVTPKSRTVIVGRNGSGKSSLLRLLCGELSPTAGRVAVYTGCKVAILHQHHFSGDTLSADMTPLQHIKSLSQSSNTALGVLNPDSWEEETQLRGYLAKFGLVGPFASLATCRLSGGQKMRLALATALYNRPDVLLLDEPTNHLDNDTVSALLEALKTYEGAVVAVSHDEGFVDNFLGTAAKDSKEGDAISELWIIKQQRLTRFTGTFKSYKRKLRQKLESAVAARKVSY